MAAGFRDSKLAAERIYWDQATVLRQIGLLRGQRMAMSQGEA